MNRLPHIAILFATVLLVAADKNPQEAKEPSAAQIKLWVKQLGDESFKVREEATRDLINAGEAACDAVTKATKSKDPEVKQRALMIIKQIGKQFEKEAIAYFKKRRGRITVDKNSPDKPMIELMLLYGDDTDAEHLKWLTSLRVLKVLRTKMTDAGMVHLKGLTDLRELSLDGFFYYPPPDISDTGLKHLSGLTNLHTLNLPNTKVTGTGLVHLKGLANLQHLNLSGNKVTDAALVHLNGLIKLQELNFAATNVSDAGLVHLKKLVELRKLNLWSTKVTDAGLVNLKGLTKLQELMLTSTNVTDAGLVHLKGLTNLKSLILWKTKVTREGIEKLQKALPKCEIDWDGR